MDPGPSGVTHDSRLADDGCGGEHLTPRTQQDGAVQ